MSVLWTIIIGLNVAVIARFIMPGDKTEPKGFILTTILGIVGAFVATYLGQSVGWYKSGESAGSLGAVATRAIGRGLAKVEPPEHADRLLGESRLHRSGRRWQGQPGHVGAGTTPDDSRARRAQSVRLRARRCAEGDQ